MPPSPQQRRRRIRRTVGAASLATFAIAWGVIAGTGAMGRTPSTSAATQRAQSVQRASSDDDWAVPQQAQQQLPAMTSRQS